MSFAASGSVSPPAGSNVLMLQGVARGSRDSGDGGRATPEPCQCRVLPCYATTSAPAGAVRPAEALRRRRGRGRTAGLSGDSLPSLWSSLYGRLQLGYARCQGGVDPPVLPVRIAPLVELPAEVLDLLLKAPGVAVVLVARLVASTSLLPVVVVVHPLLPQGPLAGP
jgi:hypothetical protein